MKAIVQDRFGPPELLAVKEIDTPRITENEVLVRIHAAAVNPLDWHTVRGIPIAARPMMGDALKWGGVRGVDFSGRIEAVGAAVSEWETGDEVYGVARGSFAEFATANPNRIAKKPAGLTDDEAAAIPVAGITALQALRNVAKLQAGQKVAITGAGGGIGTFAVQIAKALGAEVTGVCGPDKVDLVEELGADHVIDYTKKDFTANGVRYDLVFDNAYYPLSSLRRVAGPGGTVIPNGGGSPKEHWVGPIGRVLAVQLLRGPYKFFLADVTTQDLTVLSGLVESDKLRPVIDRAYGLREAVDAIKYQEGGHVRGKVVVQVAAR